MNNKLSEIRAREIIDIFNINYPFDIFKFCDNLDIRIIEDDYSKDAYLFCENGIKCIAINRKITNLNRKKFIIAHELGHYFLHGKEITFACLNINEVFNRYQYIDYTERQANEFASEILLPQKELVNNLPTTTISFDNIEKIARKYEVSLTFASIKSVENSKTENEVLLYYKDNSLKWFSTTSIFVPLPINSLPPRGSIVEEFLKNGDVESYKTNQKYIWNFIDGNVKEEVRIINPREIIVLISKANI